MASWLIQKRWHSPNSPYTGPDCGNFGVPYGEIYDDIEAARADAATMSRVIPGEYEVHEITDERAAELRKSMKERLMRAGLPLPPSIQALDSHLVKVFSDGHQSSHESARHLGKWSDGSDAYESTTIFFRDTVRLEKNDKARFVYDPGLVQRQQHITGYQFTSVSNPSDSEEASNLGFKI